jgi:hypothetical protein
MLRGLIKTKMGFIKKLKETKIFLIVNLSPLAFDL